MNSRDDVLSKNAVDIQKQISGGFMFFSLYSMQIFLGGNMNTIVVNAGTNENTINFDFYYIFLIERIL